LAIENDKNKRNDNLQIRPTELKKKIDSGENIFILDVRNDEEHESWKVSYDKYQDTPVIPIDALSSPEIIKQIPKDKQVVTFCGHGNRSMSAAKILSEKGYDARSIEGGLDGWNNVYDIASITDDSVVKIWQIRRVSKGCMSYMIANPSDKKAVIIDPTCEVDNNATSSIVNNNGLRITSAIDTHMHADHLSGATRVADRYGAKVYVSALEPYEIKNRHDHDLSVKLVEEGDKIPVGDGLVLEAIHTPGHTNGSMCFELQVNDVTKRIDNGYKSEKKIKTRVYLFTGDTLFVDGIGRPDLHNKAEEFTHYLYDSYHHKILDLPEETLILPAHYSNAFEHSKPILSTIKSSKEAMGLLSASEDKFVRYVTTSIPPQPMNYEKIISINRLMTPCDTVEEKDLEAGPNSCGIRAS
jgi:glyoxylase-like metal-dependent hydrolase (beta-lactamase superfamily II)/rhodanese-related sulfurtransferase